MKGFLRLKIGSGDLKKNLEIKFWEFKKNLEIKFCGFKKVVWSTVISRLEVPCDKENAVPSTLPFSLKS